MNFPSTHKSLLEKIKDGNEIFWEEFYRRYSPIIRYIGSLYRFTPEECDDLVQNVMLKFFNHAKKFTYREGEVKFRTYFYTIIRSQAVDHIRRNRKQTLEYCETDVQAIPFEDLFQKEWEKRILEEALDELRMRVDPHTFQAFELYGLQNRNADEVAEVLELSKEQLYVAKSRCQKLLKEIVERMKKSDEESHG
ncbi:MAG: sigma-70 family RNA polymerase sigma factor [Lentisphaeria bacterium]|nr:sigma-70 family RNA polymerase sigma factor [Lentisphaeria bacterium]